METTTKLGRALIVAMFIGCGVICSPSHAQTTSPAGGAVYKDANASVDLRVQDLLARMTLDEKIQQLRCISGAGTLLQTNDSFDAGKAGPLLANGMGHFAPMFSEPVKHVALINSIQKYLVEQTRLGIPAIMHDEGCHGFRASGATSFPVPIGLACSWDPALVEQIYDVVAGEMRARGVSHVLAPVVDICRDPRWGRADETPGEDPFLNGKLGAAMVRGFQGSANGTVAEGHVAATLKHFAGHGQPESGINRAPNDVPLRDMYDAHLVPFRIAIAEAHPAAIMPAYTEVNGVPAHNNPWLLQDVLRKEWNFGGLVVSDYNGVEYLAQVHLVAADLADAGAKALLSGVDVNLPSGRAYENLKQFVERGPVPQRTLDASVARVLRLKFAMGLFEHPHGDAQKAIQLAAKDSSKALALKAAQESIVLLKNRDGILPLPKDKYKTIAVIGPNAASARLGSYSGDPLYKISVLEGIRKKLGDPSRVVYSEGCQIITNLPESSYQATRTTVPPQFPTAEQNRTAIAAAVETAKKSDLIVLVLGENEVLSREAATARLGDRMDIDLPGAQNDLANAMFALGKPVVVYLMHGRPLAIPDIVDKADAVLDGWYMGQETGTAAADVLFGDLNPAGKLTITIPRSVGQIPVYYNAKPGARIFDYADGTNKPLFPFGFGLSYTTFAYSTPTVSAPTMQRSGQVTLSTTVTNTGQRAGDEIVQFYIHQKVSSVTRPIKELRGFQRISLAPGQSRTLSFTVDHDTLAFHDVNMNYTVEPATFELMVGPSSAELKTVNLQVME